MFSGHGLERRCGVSPWQQIVDLALGMAGDNAGDDVDEVSLRVDGVELAGLHQRSDDGPLPAAAVGAREERVLAIERDLPDRALDDVRVDLDAAVVEEAGEALPAREGVADGLGELTLLADEAELLLKPWLQRRDDEAASGLAGGTAFLGRAAFDVGLDLIERRDARERFRGDGRGATLREIVELAPDV